MFSHYRELEHDVFDARTPTGSHYFGIMYCLTEQHERKKPFLTSVTSVSNTSTLLFDCNTKRDVRKSNASVELLRHTVWRTWLFIASDE